MKVIFEDSYCRRREIGDAETLADANHIISDFLKDCNYKSYYTRMWISEDREYDWVITFDVGSHTEFFYVPFDSYDAAKIFIDAGRKNNEEN